MGIKNTIMLLCTVYRAIIFKQSGYTRKSFGFWPSEELRMKMHCCWIFGSS